MEFKDYLTTRSLWQVPWARFRQQNIQHLKFTN